MNLAPLLITHAGGTRSLPSYRVPHAEQRYEAHPELHYGSGAIVMYGDRGDAPGPFTVEAWIEADGLPAAYTLALEIVTESETATSVRTHWGAVPTDGLLAYRVIIDGSAVRLRLEFAATSATVREVGVAQIATGASVSASIEAGVAQIDEIVTGYLLTEALARVLTEAGSAILVDAGAGP